jgi:hypothetical protein
MCKNSFWRLKGSWMVVLGLVLMGCAGGGSVSLSPPVPAPQTAEQLLSAAGFQQVIPTTLAQRTKFLNMPQKQIFLISKGPKVSYVYADASGCGCLYAGNRQNYQNFQKLLREAQIAAEQYQAAQMAEWDWNTWGPGWWGETGTLD